MNTSIHAILHHGTSQLSTSHLGVIDYTHPRDGIVNTPRCSVNNLYINLCFTHSDSNADIDDNSVKSQDNEQGKVINVYIRYGP